MLAPALVLLSSRDADAPDLPGVATVSKDAVLDDGGLALGIAAVARGAVWCDRPFVTGNPSDDWMVGKVARNRAVGCDATQIGNEPNLPLEGWVGGSAAYATFYRRVRERTPGAVVLYAPMSPGVPGWETWVATDAPAYAVHAYGDLDGMRSVVRWYLDATRGDLWITECNPGAGNTFDLDAWATTDLRPFLAWCATEERIRLCAYFAWRWDQSVHLPTSVDAAGTAVVDVLRAWGPPKETPVATTKGIDISNNQGPVDLGLVEAAGYQFVAMKAAGDEGANNVFLDPFFPENWHQANAHELVRIAYTYARPSRVSPAQSVTTLERAIQAVGGLKTGDSIALDLEDPGVPDGVSLHQWTAEWLALAQQVFGATPFLYSAHYYTSTHDLEGHADLGAYPLWFAAWQSTPPSPPPGWVHLTMWQNSSSASVPGVQGACDTDVFFGTAAALRGLGRPASAGSSGPDSAGPDATTSALDGLWSLTERLATIEHAPLAEEFQRKIADLKSAIGRG